MATSAGKTLVPQNRRPGEVARTGRRQRQPVRRPEGQADARSACDGANASVLKYDILTALLAFGLHDEAAGARLAPRLAVLITARFNWQSETLIVGQKEIARLWGVTERTAKREIALMRARGWLIVRRPAARGRVTEHGIDLARLLADTRPVWDAVGPDFAARLSHGDTAPDNVVPFVRAEAPVADGTLWARFPSGSGTGPDAARVVVRQPRRGRAGGGTGDAGGAVEVRRGYVATHFSTRSWRPSARSTRRCANCALSRGRAGGGIRRWGWTGASPPRLTLRRRRGGSWSG